MERLRRTRAGLAALCTLAVFGITVPGAAAPGEGTYVLDSMASTASWSGEVAAGDVARDIACL